MAGVIGSSIQDLDTPALLVDGPAMQRNIERMAAFFRGRPCQLRPHFKNHKCTRIARLQLAAGNTIGMTCAKLGEAQVLADAGITDILIANQVVGHRKVERLVQLARRADLRVAVDHLDHITSISQAAAASGVTVGLLVEVDIGMGRCGVPPGEAALELARRITELPGVRFDGLQAYEGHLVSIPDAQERRSRTLDAFEHVLHTRRMIQDAGLAGGVISGGSTTTYDVTGLIDGVGELQAGTYVTMDATYGPIRPEFEQALSVAARVISRPKSEVAVVDVGMKGIAPEFGPPRVKGHPQAQIPALRSEEHCVIRNAAALSLGQVIELIPTHACTTCNLYREIHIQDEGCILEVWPIEASGCLQ